MCVDDREDAASVLAAAFPAICEFVDAARSAGGVVFVHCGAGISRAPTATCAYLIWKLRIGAAAALQLVRRARTCARPNPGFVRELKAWEQQLLDGAAVVPVGVAGVAAPGVPGLGEVDPSTS